MNKTLIIWLKYNNIPIGACYFKNKDCCNTNVGFYKIRKYLKNFNDRLSRTDKSSEFFVHNFFAVTDKNGENRSLDESLPGLSEISYNYMKDKHKKEFKKSFSELYGVIIIEKEELKSLKNTADKEIIIDFATNKLTMQNFNINDRKKYYKTMSLYEVNFNFDNLPFNELDNAIQFIRDADPNIPFVTKKDANTVYEIILQK